jgi:hypothetical protein
MAEKTLCTGKKVVVNELSALEEVLAYQLLGKSYDEKNMIGTATLQRSLLTLLSIGSVDGVDYVPPKSLEDAFTKLKDFSKKEWNEIQALYSEVNDVDMGE